ncbi:5,10-methylenetetrahydrofolate reductase [hydrothermal vent metagenome]|uniref:methylenetetrahydrofolate reductase (NADH) n=1 Tax=hydrothermal vent metagenome TaxID=652676 RepID=A0A3B1A3R7_9ZZZZ
MESQKKHPKHFSFEFFPPKTPEGAEKLKTVRSELGKLKPKYFSVTFGAGGSTQDGTMDAVLDIQKAGFNAAPHISCMGTDKEIIVSLLEQYKNNGIKQLVVLRGDMPSGAGSGNHGDFSYANELVGFIRNKYNDHFHLEVAAYPEFHPQAVNAEADLDNFKRKVEAGANSAITQYFFNADAYFQFVDACEKRDVFIPITPGIMPITNYTQLARFSDMCGSEIPRWIRKRLEAYGDDKASIRGFGEEVVTHMCERLLAAGAPGLHFYTMNQTGPTKALWNNLNLSQV